MKITKLFHWLYAILILLPVFFIGGRMIYTSFNKNANQSWSGQNQVNINYKYQTNEVNSNNDFIIGHIYEFTLNNQIFDELTSSNFSLSFNVISFKEFYFDYDESIIEDVFLNEGESPSLYTIDIGINTVTNILSFTYYVPTDDSYVGVYFSVVVDNTFSIKFIGQYYTGSLVNNNAYILINSTNYNQIESVDITQDTLDNAFLYSLNQINDVPLFSWAKNSFLNEPFTYITNLFGVPSDSPINTLLSYWLDISIIWLVFDAVVYLPLLIHRWLDKGIVE